MTAEFNWWLLIVGIVAGAGLTWLVLADSARREHDLLDRELPAEAGWLSRTLADEGIAVDPEVAEALLRAHRRYLGLPPPDAFVDPTTLERIDPDAEDAEPGSPESTASIPGSGGHAAAVAPGQQVPPHPKREGAL